jgi:1-acyl-sn-glycerol-3-phosphate acyltransferase
MGSLFRYAAGWLFLIAYWLSAVTLHLLLLKRTPVNWLAAAIRAWGYVSLRLLGIRLELLNPSTIATREARVVITNHQSALDLLWGAAVCPPAPLAIGKREVAYVPILNLVWWALDFVRIDRSNSTTSVKALSEAGRKIKAGQRSLVIAPEGTRTPDGSILPFKKGAFHIARQAGVPIHPIVVASAFESMSKKSLMPRPGTIRVLFLPPVSAQEVRSARDESELIERIRGDMTRAYAEINGSPRLKPL